MHYRSEKYIKTSCCKIWKRIKTRLLILAIWLTTVIYSIAQKQKFITAKGKEIAGKIGSRANGGRSD
jgi:hypothetical protein